MSLEDPVPEELPPAEELTPARELLAQARTYKADAEKNSAAVHGFFESVTKGARDTREAYRWAAHAYGILRETMAKLRQDAREERDLLVARDRAERSAAVLREKEARAQGRKTEDSPE